MFTLFILALLLCIAGYYITSQVQGIGYQNQYYLMDKLFAMAKYAYLLSDVLIHDSKVTEHRNKLLETLVSQEHITDIDRYYLTELMNIDSSDKMMNVSSSIRQMSREYILQLKNEASILSKQVNFDFKVSHKELRDDIQSLRTRIDEFIEREFNDDKNESENDNKENA